MALRISPRVWQARGAAIVGEQLPVELQPGYNELVTRFTGAAHDFANRNLTESQFAPTRNTAVAALEDLFAQAKARGGNYEKTFDEPHKSAVNVIDQIEMLQNALADRPGKPRFGGEFDRGIF